MTNQKVLLCNGSQVTCLKWTVCSQWSVVDETAQRILVALVYQSVLALLKALMLYFYLSLLSCI